jgi:hypothetical protein
MLLLVGDEAQVTPWADAVAGPNSEEVTTTDTIPALSA